MIFLFCLKHGITLLQACCHGFFHQHIFSSIHGIGNISSAHINGLLEFPERAKIVALCDIYPEKAEAAKKKYNLTDAVVFDDHQKMLASDIKIDIVHVCTTFFNL